MEADRILAGDLKGEHLMLKRRGDTAVLVSHELKIASAVAIPHYFDRTLASLPWDDLVTAVSELSGKSYRQEVSDA